MTELQPLSTNEYDAVGRISYFDSSSNIVTSGAGGFFEGENNSYFFITAAHIVDDLENILDENQLILSQGEDGSSSIVDYFYDDEVYIFPDPIADLAVIKVDLDESRMQELNLDSNNFFHVSPLGFNEVDKFNIPLNFYLGADSREPDYNKYITDEYYQILLPERFIESETPIRLGDSGGLVTYKIDDEEYITGIISSSGGSAERGYSFVFSNEVVSFINEIADNDGIMPHYLPPNEYENSDPRYINNNMLAGLTFSALCLTAFALALVKRPRK